MKTNGENALPAANAGTRTKGAKAGGPWLLPASFAAAAGVGMALVASFVQVPKFGPIKETASEAARPSLEVTRVEWLKMGGEVRERLRLLDPTPLFMPGARIGGGNFNPDGIVDRPAGEVAALVPPALTFSDARPARGILRPSLPETAVAAAEAAAATRWFAGLARTDAEPRGAGPDPVAISGSGKLGVYPRGETESVAVVALPRDPLLESSAWRPMELGVLIDAAGAVTAPTITTGSGVAEVDERVRTLVGKELLPGLRLRPGAYRFVVGP